MIIEFDNEEVEVLIESLYCQLQEDYLEQDEQFFIKRLIKKLGEE